MENLSTSQRASLHVCKLRVCTQLTFTIEEQQTTQQGKTASLESVMHLKQLQYHQPHVVSSIIVFALCGSTFESRREPKRPRESEVAPADKAISHRWIRSAGWRQKGEKKNSDCSRPPDAIICTAGSGGRGGGGGRGGRCRAKMEAEHEGGGAR